jgi:hypothetical protein
MGKPRFFQSVLKEVKGDIFNHVYGGLFKNTTIKELMGNDEGNCPECDCNSWIILPKESVAVKEGGKPYLTHNSYTIECMNCGLTSHL